MKNYTKKTIEFYNQYIEKYIKNGAVVLEDKINRFINFIPGSKVLDVACGPGHDTDYLTKKGFDCLGIDLSEKMIKFAKKHYQGKFRVMDFFDLDFKEGSFDGIWCSSAFVHISKSDLSGLLKNFKKLLKRNGILGIVTPGGQKRIKRKEDSRIFTMFDKKELEEYLKSVNFKIVESRIFSFKRMKWLFILSKVSQLR